MCLSPDEMTTEHIENVIAYYAQSVAELEMAIEDAKAAAPGRDRDAKLRILELSLRRAAAYLERYEALLKERAEAGAL